jgi:hypothetical protein
LPTFLRKTREAVVDNIFEDKNRMLKFKKKLRREKLNEKEKENK